MSDLTATSKNNLISMHNISVDKLLSAASPVSDEGSKKVYLSNYETGAPVRILEGHTGSVWTVAFKNNLLASGSIDNTIKIWNIETGSLIRTLVGHTDAVCLIAFNNSNILASQSMDKTIKMWNVENGELIRTLKGQSYDFRLLSALSDNNLIASYKSLKWIYPTGLTPSADNVIKIWNAETGDLLRTLEGHQDDRVRTVAFNSDNILASGGDHGFIKIWNPESGELIRTLKNDNPIIFMEFINDNLLAATSYSTVDIWNIETGRVIRTVEGGSIQKF